HGGRLGVGDGAGGGAQAMRLAMHPREDRGRARDRDARHQGLEGRTDRVDGGQPLPKDDLLQGLPLGSGQERHRGGWRLDETRHQMTQALATTLVVASLYALLGAGYVLVYRASRVLNLAQGDLLTLGGYLLFAVTGTIGAAPALAVPVALGLSTLAGFLIYHALMRPMAGHPIFAAVLVTVT